MRDGKDAYIVNYFKNAYGKDKINWYTEWMDQGLLRYYNKEKTRAFANKARLQLPSRYLQGKGPLNDRKKTDADLVKLKKQKGYVPRPHGDDSSGVCAPSIVVVCFPCELE